MTSGGAEHSRQRAVELALVTAVSLLYALPLAGSRYFPGLDLPWHAAVVAVLERGDPDYYLGYFDSGWQLSSYAVMYALVTGLAKVFGDVAVAMQVVVGLYLVAFVWSARSLVRACGGSGTWALLAAPAAYSMTLEYGFLAYAITFPMTLQLWALVQDSMTGARYGWRLAAIGALFAGVSMGHPFAAAVAGLVAGLLVLLQLDRQTVRRGLGIAAALAVGAVPAALAVLSVAESSQTVVARSLADADLWTRLTAQKFSGALESASAAPVRLLGFVGDGWRYVVVAAALIALVAGRRAAGESDPRAARSRRVAWWLVVVLALGYFLTPFTFEWPRDWYGAQPRLLPLLWVALVAALSPSAVGGRWMRVAPVAVAAFALLLVVAQGLWPFYREASHFHRVVDESGQRLRTLGLIEQPAALDRRPASPFRHFTAWVLVRRGGFVSYLPMSAPILNAGGLVPVGLADDAPAQPAAPFPGAPRSFDWEQHAAGWDQFLIRDADPQHPFDYFRDRASEVILVTRSGSWRLYRRVRSGDSGP